MLNPAKTIICHKAQICKLGNFQLIKTLTYSNLFSFPPFSRYLPPATGPRDGFGGPSFSLLPLPSPLRTCLRRRGRNTGSGASLSSLPSPSFTCTTRAAGLSLRSRDTNGFGRVPLLSPSLPVSPSPTNLHPNRQIISHSMLLSTPSPHSTFRLNHRSNALRTHSIRSRLLCELRIPPCPSLHLPSLLPNVQQPNPPLVPSKLHRHRSLPPQPLSHFIYLAQHRPCSPIGSSIAFTCFNLAHIISARNPSIAHCSAKCPLR